MEARGRSESQGSDGSDERSPSASPSPARSRTAERSQGRPERAAASKERTHAELSGNRANTRHLMRSTYDPLAQHGLLPHMQS